MAQKEHYFGSVRFFKNMLLLTFVVLLSGLTILTILMIHYHSRYKEAIEQEETEVVSDIPSVSADIETEPLAYQESYPDFYAPQPYAATSRTSRAVYVTFNSVPSERTDELLSVLAQYDVKATFFVSGNVQNDPQYDARLRAIVESGHTLGMGSWSNERQMVYSSVEAYLADMYTLFTHIKDATGTTPTVFRFVDGSINSYNTAIYHKLIAEMVRRGFVPYDWNVSFNSSMNLGADEMVFLVYDAMTGLDRAILCFSDDAQQTATVEAMPGIIEILQDNGYILSALTPEVKPVLFAYPK